MTGVSHSIVTFATLYVATHNVFIAGSAMLGSLFPDKSEGLLAVRASFLFPLVCTVCGSAGLFLDAGRVVCDRGTDVAGGPHTDDAAVPFLVCRRGTAPYTGRRRLRTGTGAVSHQTDDGAAPPVQSGLGGGVPFCHSVLRGSVSDCDKTVGGFRRFPVLTGREAGVTALRDSDAVSYKKRRSAYRRMNQCFLYNSL